MNNSNERNPMVVSGVVGDVLDPFTAITELRVSYDGKIICNGCNLRPSKVSSRPRVDIGGDEFRSFYTLVMVDADAPNPGDPCYREYLHWLVTDIPGSTGANFGRELVSYEIPQPSMGIHRLVLALFQQPCRLTMVAPQWRNNFKTRDFSQCYNLGSPVAAIYYNCQRENGTGGRRTVP